MKHITTLLTILFISLLSSPSLSETVTMDDLVQKEDLYYKKFHIFDIIFSSLDFTRPFTGKVSGTDRGKFYEGRKKGSWEYYNENGQLTKKVNYNEGKEESLIETIHYYNSGGPESKGNFLRGEKDGLWKYYDDDGELISKLTWKNGKKDFLEEFYDEDGKLRSKGYYKNGLKDGFWEKHLGVGEIEQGNFKSGEKMDIGSTLVQPLDSKIREIMLMV